MNDLDLIRRSKIGTVNERLTQVDPIHLQWLMNKLRELKNGILVECGVLRGGCIALCAIANPNFKIYGLDSWEAMPEITERDDEVKCKSSIGVKLFEMEDVYDTFDKLESPMDNVTLIKGWFTETIPSNKKLFNQIDILRLDSDFYESVKYCLDELYDNVKSGGIIILDDWHFNPDGVRGAVQDLFKEKGINPEIIIHTNGRGPAYFIKP